MSEQKARNVREAARSHPHGLPSPEMIDAEGRCRWCVDLASVANLERQLAEVQDRGVFLWRTLEEWLLLQRIFGGSASEEYIIDLEAENARLQTQVEEAERQLAEAKGPMLERAERERDRYKARWERCKDALVEDAKNQHKHGPTCNWDGLPKPQLCVKCSLVAAIEEEGKGQ